jgi:hypothetical protein
MGARRSNRNIIVFVVLLLAAAGVGLGARRILAARSQAAASATAASSAPRGAFSFAFDPGEVVLHVPHAPASIIIDGDTDDPGWLRPPGPARTGAFVLPNGAATQPYSDARLVWGDGQLYLALYASDEDIESHVETPDSPLWLEDDFRVEFRNGDMAYSIEVSPKGVVTDGRRKGNGEWDYTWNAGAHVSKEMDGSLNEPKDRDEEWMIEMAIPFESLGMKGEPGESIWFSARRCDVPKESPRICTGWGEGDAKGRLVLQ